MALLMDRVGATNPARSGPSLQIDRARGRTHSRRDDLGVGSLGAATLHHSAKWAKKTSFCASTPPPNP